MTSGTTPGGETMDSMRKHAEQWAVEAGHVLASEFGHKMTIVSDPDKKNFSTALDVQVESILHQHIRDTYPDHGFLGEEEATTYATSSQEYIWVVDPMD